MSPGDLQYLGCGLLVNVDFKVCQRLNGLLGDCRPLPPPVLSPLKDYFPPSLRDVACSLYLCQVWPSWIPG